MMNITFDIYTVGDFIFDNNTGKLNVHPIQFTRSRCPSARTTSTLSLLVACIA